MPVRGLVATFVLTAALAAQSPRNVLVLVADDLGVDVVGCYGEGASPPPTPNIDALAARGVLFRNAWAFPSCSPTRACLQTARYPFRTLVGRWIQYPSNTAPIGTLQPREWTVPEVLDLAGSGYAHAAIGKWHLSDVTEGLDVPRTRGGFGHFVGTMWGQVPSYYAWPRVSGGVEQTSTAYITTQQVDDALAWIGGQTRPWYCYLAFTAPHLPFEVPPAHLHTRNVTPSSPQRELYKAIIEALDTEIGRLLTALGPALANTDIVFVGDNGSVQNMAEAPFLPARAKGTAYEGGVNVPLLVAGPSVVQGGREVTALACVVDIPATVLELCGAAGAMPPWVELDGVSLVPYLVDPTRAPIRQFAFTEEFIGDVWPRPNQNGHATVRNDRFKLIHRYGGSDELFDLQGDPWESTNLLSRTLTPTEQSNYAALLGEIGRLRTPRAAVTAFGHGCTGSSGTPSLVAVGAPRVGATYRVELTGAAPSVPSVAVVGFSTTRWGSVPLPFDLASIGGGAGCTVWTSGEIAVPQPTSAAGDAATNWTVPNQLALVGTTLFHAWLVVDATAPGNALGVVATGAAAATIGL